MLLADMGAEVIKVEPPHGDPQRLVGPTKEGVPIVWSSINRNKKCIVIDLRNPEGKKLLMELVASSDIVYNNYRPEVMDRLGFGFESLKTANPKIIMANLTGYGMTGPRKLSPAYDIAIQSLTGGMSVTGHPGAPPARAGIPLADLAGGMFLSLAVLGALRKRDLTGEGFMLDISLFDASISLLMYWAGLALNTGQIPPPQGSGNSQVYPYGAFPTLDGWVIVAPYSGTFWPKLCDTVGRPDLVTDERFIDNSQRLQNRSELEVILNEEFKKKTSRDWLDLLEANDVPCAPVNTVNEAMADPQTVARDMLIEIPIEATNYYYAGNPVKTFQTEKAHYAAPARLGQHTREVLRDIAGIDDDQITALAGEGVIRVEDVSGPAWRGRVASE
jgi:crotonobetainyl-CoA:carnitine CoA-transferase CaiB-like acyl-CoA transferase